MVSSLSFSSSLFGLLIGVIVVLLDGPGLLPCSSCGLLDFSSDGLFDG